MTSFRSMILLGLIALVTPASSEACGRHRARCHSDHRITAAAYYPSAATPMASYPMAAYPTSQMVQTPATVAPSPVPFMAASPVETPGVQPAYDYAAATNGQPAYYYTYDKSGKLIIAQWMDWVFRGGRAAGEPAPPLPIIGALRNR